MKLKDTKLGDTVIVYLGVGGILCNQIVRGSKEQFPLRATVVGTANQAYVMLGFDDTVACVPNDVARNVVGHTHPGYVFLQDFHKQYQWTVWTDNDLECEAFAFVVGAQATPAIKRYPNNVCPCGIHLDLCPCDYHPYQKP